MLNTPLVCIFSHTLMLFHLKVSKIYNFYLYLVEYGMWKAEWILNQFPFPLKRSCEFAVAPFSKHEHTIVMEKEWFSGSLAPSVMIREHIIWK